ncbi:MAG: Uma2 family endonuclease [Pseudomonadota bacterium]
MIAVKKNATYADLEKVPDTMIAQLIDGNLVTMPRPHPRHGAASNSLSSEISPPYQKGRGGPGGWVFFDEPELRVGIQVLVPDLVGFRRETLPELPKGNAFNICPDWICEVLSPSTQKYDRGAKMRIYRDWGVKHYWLLDPQLEFLEVYENGGETFNQLATFERGEDVCAAPFKDISFPLEDLFPFGPEEESEK